MCHTWRQANSERSPCWESGPPVPSSSTGSLIFDGPVDEQHTPRPHGERCLRAAKWERTRWKLNKRWYKLWSLISIKRQFWTFFNDRWLFVCLRNYHQTLRAIKMKIKAITTIVITLDSFANYFNRNLPSHAWNLIRWEVSGDFPKPNKRRFSAESYPTNKCGLWWIFWQLWNAKVSLHLKQSHIPHFFRFSPTQSVEKEFVREIRGAQTIWHVNVYFSAATGNEH